MKQPIGLRTSIRMVSNLEDDPRDESKVVRLKYTPEGDAVEGDVYAVLSLVMGFLGVSLKYKFAAWLSLICGIASVANMKQSEMHFTHILSSLTFAIMGIAINYLGPQLPRF